MKFLRIPLACGALAFATSVRAVYAPIPIQEQGRDFTYSVSSGISYDSNIFGAPTNAISSFVYELAPQLSFNASLSQQTFFSASYRLTLDYFDSRPGEKLLIGHDANLRLAHAFTQASSIDLTEAFKITHDPEALLSGTPVNTDQSYLSNEVDGRFTTSVGEKTAVVLKARTLYYDYYNPLLGSELNRFENLYGIEANYAYLPDFKLAGEFRHQDVDYQSDPSGNNKHSEFLMAGFDYAPGPKLSVTVRVGAEFRHRESDQSDETAPYVELSAKYVYAKQSFISGGYVYDLTETSDPVHFTDEKTNRLFINLQHQVTAYIVLSASADYEPGILLGKPGTPDVNETSTHDGLAISYLPNKNWTIAATYDYDHTNSGLAYRDLDRERAGVNAKFTF